MTTEAFTRRCQRDAAVVALEQADAQLFLHGPDGT